MLKMVKKEVGITFVPESFNKLQWPGMPILIPFANPKLRTKLSLVTLRNEYIQTASKHFIDMVKDMASLSCP